MTRTTARRLWILGLVVAWGCVIVTTICLIRNPPTPQINHCPNSDPANRWCLE